MAPIMLIAGLTDAERVLLGEALTALRRARATAWNQACDEAEAQGKQRPSLKPYAINSIRQLARRLDCPPTHWMED